MRCAREVREAKRLEAELEVLRGEWADNRRILDEALRLLGAEHYQEIPERIREIRHYLLDRCQRTCQGREKYAGRLRHEPNCPAYDLGLIEETP